MTPDNFHHDLSPSVRQKYITDLRRLYIGRVLAAHAAVLGVAMVVGTAVFNALSRLGVSENFAGNAGTLLSGIGLVLAIMLLDPDNLRRVGHPLAHLFVRFEPSNEDDQMLQVLWHDSRRLRDTRRIALSIVLAGVLVSLSIFASAMLSGLAGQTLRLFQSGR